MTTRSTLLTLLFIVLGALGAAPALAQHPTRDRRMTTMVERMVKLCSETRGSERELVQKYEKPCERAVARLKPLGARVLPLLVKAYVAELRGDGPGRATGFYFSSEAILSAIASVPGGGADAALVSLLAREDLQELHTPFAAVQYLLQKRNPGQVVVRKSEIHGQPFAVALAWKRWLDGRG